MHCFVLSCSDPWVCKYLLCGDSHPIPGRVRVIWEWKTHQLRAISFLHLSVSPCMVSLLLQPILHFALTHNFELWRCLHFNIYTSNTFHFNLWPFVSKFKSGSKKCSLSLFLSKRQDLGSWWFLLGDLLSISLTDGQQFEHKGWTTAPRIFKQGLIYPMIVHW